MKIDDRRDTNIVKFKNLKAGDVFTFIGSSNFYMKTKGYFESRQCPYSTEIIVLNDGSIWHGEMDPDREVIKVNCKLVVE